MNPDHEDAGLLPILAVNMRKRDYYLKGNRKEFNELKRIEQELNPITEEERKIRAQ